MNPWDHFGVKGRKRDYNRFVHCDHIDFHLRNEIARVSTKGRLKDAMRLGSPHGIIAIVCQRLKDKKLVADQYEWWAKTLITTKKLRYAKYFPKYLNNLILFYF